MAVTRLRKSSSSPRLDDSALWQAVVTRDSDFDGRFVFSVQSTGVYCRPSCRSRRARRENVRFHATCAAAEAAGFRPCKRCRPNATSVQEEEASRVARACRLIETSDVELRLADIAAAAGLSPHHFHHLFKNHTGVTPKAYFEAHRHKAVRRTIQSTARVADAMFDAGYGSSGRFYATSNQVLGMTPRAYRDGGTGAEITYALGSCSLGYLLVAASAKGICAILLGDERQTLIEDLNRRFPKATIVAGARAFERLVAKVVRFVDQPKSGLNLPLDIRGTAFQHRVWQALQKIPAGRTATYTDIAEAIGAPKAVRAVASACAANPIAVAVPCHRVVGASGALSGYRWGIERKRALLDKERK